MLNALLIATRVVSTCCPVRSACTLAALSIFNPLKSATPATAAFVLVPLNVPPPGLFESPASRSTCPCYRVAAGILQRHRRLRAQAVPAVPPPGWIVNASLFAAPE